MEKWLHFMHRNHPARLIVILNGITILALLTLFSVVWVVVKSCG